VRQTYSGKPPGQSERSCDKVGSGSSRVRVEIEISSLGTRIAIQYRDDGGCKVAVYSIPSLALVAIEGFPSSIGHNLRLQGELAPVYLQIDDVIYRWDPGSQSGFQEFRRVEGLGDYTFPSVSQEVYVSSPGSISIYVVNMTVPKWSCPIGGGAPSLQTDAGGWMIYGFDTNRLLLIENTREYSGSMELWTVFGTVVIIQVLGLFLIAYRNQLRTLNRRNVPVLAIGAIAGLMVAAILPDQLYMDWMGEELTYFFVSMIVAGIISLVVWRGQAGLGGIALGTVLGIPLAIGLSLAAAFFIWVFGYQFPGDEEIFKTVAYSIPMGFKMGLTGSLAGAVLSRLFPQKS
jgi:hypothetical protein